jgi:hypothetical protein
MMPVVMRGGSVRGNNRDSHCGESNQSKQNVAKHLHGTPS